MKVKLLISLALFTGSIASAGQSLLICAGGKVNRFQVDAKTGALTEMPGLDIRATGPLGASPDGKTFYANTTALGIDPKAPKAKTHCITTFAFGSDGNLQVVGEPLPSKMSTGYLRTDSTGRFLAGNNYRDGQVTVWKLSEQGVYEGDVVRTMDLERCAHAAVFSPDNQTLFVPATAPNKIFQLKFNADTGEIVPRQPSAAPGPIGEEKARQPRHLVFHPEKPIAFATHERFMPGAGVYSYDADKGILNLKQDILSLEPDQCEGMTTATLHLSNDARFLYVSNRDGLYKAEPEKARDSITLFSVDPKTGHLTLINRTPCPQQPRSFCLGQKGQFAFVGGQIDQKLASYRVDLKTGHLTEFGERINLPGPPTWLMCVEE